MREAFVMVLESRSCTEVNDLRSVIGCLEEWNAQVNRNRAERRLPGDREAGRGADGEIVLDATDGEIAGRQNGVEMADGADVVEQRQLDAVAVWQEGRQLELGAGDDEEVAADGAIVARDREGARADTGLGKAAEAVAALEETLLDRDGLAVIAGDVSGLQVDRGDDVVPEQRV